MNLTDLYDAILNGKLDRAVAVTNEAISEGVLPNEIITNYMIKAMEEIGNRFEAGKVFVPNLLMSARAMKGALDILKPLLQGETDAYVGKIVIGTVKGDLHDIGKNLVASMFEGCGFEVVNLGVDVSSEKFVEAARTNNAVNSTLAVSNIRNRTYTNCEVYLIDYGYGNFKEKIHFME